MVGPWLARENLDEAAEYLREGSYGGGIVKAFGFFGREQGYAALSRAFQPVTANPVDTLTLEARFPPKADTKR